MTEPANDAVLIEQRGRVMIVTINRPEARNAVNRDVSVRATKRSRPGPTSRHEPKERSQ